MHDLLMMVCGFGSTLMLFYVATLLSVGCRNVGELGKSKAEYWFWSLLYYLMIVLALLCAVVGAYGLVKVLSGLVSF